MKMRLILTTCKGPESYGIYMSSQARDPIEQVGMVIVRKQRSISLFQTKSSSFSKLGTNPTHVKIVHRKRDGTLEVRDKEQAAARPLLSSQPWHCHGGTLVQVLLTTCGCVPTGVEPQILAPAFTDTLDSCPCPTMWDSNTAVLSWSTRREETD